MYRLNLPDDLKEAAEIEKQGARKIVPKSIKFSKKYYPIRSDPTNNMTPKSEDSECQYQKNNIETKEDSDQISHHSAISNVAESEDDDSDEFYETNSHLSMWVENDSKKWVYGDAEAHQWEVSIRLKTPETTCKDTNEEFLLRANSNIESASLSSTCEVKRNATVENPQKVRQNVEMCKQNFLLVDECANRSKISLEKENKEETLISNNHMVNENSNGKTRTSENVKLGKAATLTILSRRSNKQVLNILVSEKQAIEELTSENLDRVNCDRNTPMVAEVRRSQTVRPISVCSGAPRDRNTALVTPKISLSRTKSWGDKFDSKHRPDNESPELALLLSKIVKTQANRTPSGLLRPLVLETEQPEIYYQPQHLKKDLRKLLYYFAIRGSKTPNCAERIWLPQCFTEMLKPQEVDKLHKCMNELMQSVPSTSEDSSESELNQYCTDLVDLVKQGVYRVPPCNQQQSPADTLYSPTKSLAPEQARRLESVQTLLMLTPDFDTINPSFELRELTLHKTTSDNTHRNGFDEERPQSNTLLQYDEHSTDDSTESEVDIIFPPEKGLAVEQARYMESARPVSFACTPDLNIMMPSFEIRELALNKAPSIDPEKFHLENQQLPTSSVFQLFDSPVAVTDKVDLDRLKRVTSGLSLKKLNSFSSLNQKTPECTRILFKRRSSSTVNSRSRLRNRFTIGGKRHQNPNKLLPTIYIRSVDRTSRFAQIRSSPGGDLKYMKRFRRPRSATRFGSKLEGRKVNRLLEFLAKENNSITAINFACLRQSRSSVDKLPVPTVRRSSSQAQFTFSSPRGTSCHIPIFSNNRSKESRSRSAEDSPTCEVFLKPNNQDVPPNSHAAETNLCSAPHELSISLPTAEPQQKSKGEVNEGCFNCGADCAWHSYDIVSQVYAPIIDFRLENPMDDQAFGSNGLVLVKTKQNVSEDELVHELEECFQRIQRKYEINVLTSSACGRHVVHLKLVDPCASSSEADENRKNKLDDNINETTSTQKLIKIIESNDKHSENLENEKFNKIHTQIEESTKSEHQPSTETHIEV